MKWTRDYIADDLEILKILDATDYGVYKALKTWAGSNYIAGEISLAGMAPDPKNASKTLKISLARYETSLKNIQNTCYPGTEIPLITVERDRILYGNWRIFQDDYDNRKHKNNVLRTIAANLDKDPGPVSDKKRIKNGQKTDKSTTVVDKKTVTEVEVELDVDIEKEVEAKMHEPMEEVYRYSFPSRGLIPPKIIMDEITILKKKHGDDKVKRAMIFIGKQGYGFGNVKKVLEGNWSNSPGARGGRRGATGLRDQIDED